MDVSYVCVDLRPLRITHLQVGIVVRGLLRIIILLPLVRPSALAAPHCDARERGHAPPALFKLRIRIGIRLRSPKSVLRTAVLGLSDAVVTFVRPIVCNCVCFELRHALPYSLVYALNLLAESRQLLIVLAALRGRSQACSSHIPFGRKRNFSGEEGK